MIPYNILDSSYCRKHHDSLLECTEQLENFHQGVDTLLNQINKQKRLAKPNLSKSRPFKDRDTMELINDLDMTIEYIDTSATASAVFDFTADEENMISFKKKDRITDVKTVSGVWWYGTCHGKTGRFPANHVNLDKSASSLKHIRTNSNSTNNSFK